MKAIFRALNDQRGSALVIVAAALVTLLSAAALVVDIGVLYLNKAKLQNEVDAAALAGVQDLPASPAQAVLSARQYAGLNGLPEDVIAVAVNGNSQVVVTARRSVGLFFAKIFDKTAADVHAAATAAIFPVKGASGIVPFGVVKQSFVFGQDYTLKAGAGDGYDGNYGGLGLGGNGAAVYLANIKLGYDGLVSVGDWISTEPGNISGPTSSGVNYRIAADPTATYQTVQKDSPRIVIIPIIDSLAVSGKSEVLVVGFGAFFLESVGGSGNENYVTGKFMQMVTPGDIDRSGTVGSYGVYGSALIK